MLRENDIFDKVRGNEYKIQFYIFTILFKLDNTSRKDSNNVIAFNIKIKKIDREFCFSFFINIKPPMSNRWGYISDLNRSPDRSEPMLNLSGISTEGIFTFSI